MKKEEYIKRYGEEAYLRKLEKEKEYREKNRETLKKNAKEYYLKNRDKILKKSHENYNNDKELYLSRQKEYSAANKDSIKKYKQEYYAAHAEDIKNRSIEYYRERKDTKEMRAAHLLCGYRLSEKRHKRGECTITKQWIIDNIFNSQCIYCGETDWKKLGCDRIDDNKPHTPENCVCACSSCNIERYNKRQSVDEFIKNKNVG